LVKKKVAMIPVEQRKSMIDNDPSSPVLSRQCCLLSVHRSGIYYRARSESEENLRIMRFLDEQYFQTPFYGLERLLVLLQLSGYRVNRKRLRRLMRLVGWQTLFPGKRTSISDNKAYKYPYLLGNLEITHPNQVWAIDITYIPMQRGFMYLFAIIDLYSRYVVGWSLSNTMSAGWCVDTIEGAIAQYGVPQIINSDQGCQFTSELYVACLEKHGISISMDGKGRAIDNVFIERLWRSVKYEHVYLYAYDDGNQLWKGLDEYFRFYNHKRIHQSLGYRIPSDVYCVKYEAA
jgi:putative transposase